MTGGVQALYQTTDSKGHQVVFDWVSNSLNEFTPNQGWLDVGSVDQVAQDGINNALLFTHANTLYLVTGAPGNAVPILNDVQSLTTSSVGQLALQIGTYFKTNLTENVDNSGNVTLSFFSVQFNVGRFAADFFNNLTTNLQTFTIGAEGVADALTQPLINQPWASGLTTGGLMNILGYNDTPSAQALADTILASNHQAAQAREQTSGSTWAISTPKCSRRGAALLC